MSLINEAVIGNFSKWATENEDKDIFPSISKEDKSYYINRSSEETYIMEYSFQTMAELKRALEQYSGLAKDSLMLKMITIEICQNRFIRELVMNKTEENNSQEINKKNDNKTLPEFVYVF